MVHIFQSLALGLWKEKERPHGCDEHPRGEKVPCAVAKRVEDVWESLCDDELGQPVKAALLVQILLPWLSTACLLTIASEQQRCR